MANQVPSPSTIPPSSLVCFPGTPIPSALPFYVTRSYPICRLTCMPAFGAAAEDGAFCACIRTLPTLLPTPFDLSAISSEQSPHASSRSTAPAEHSDPSPSFLPLLSLFPPTRYEAPIPALDGDQRQKKPFKNGRREKGGTARERTEAQLVSLQKRTEVEGRKQPKIMAGTSFKRGDEDHARCSRRRSGSETVHARFTEGGCGVQRRGRTAFASPPPRAPRLRHHQ
ncbi:hypothetical protein OPV22_013211 [Ensete ventricosum]|uniref:Small EDRK-rich factor-like N-terminal domain-containing protein n=1 Tax=Ensete ventricosum TaxID=4639 RepID=A0AAV8QYV4_ENSVE|nr:hypothetical protein OPV22_013211 [Ensete ventricosum]